MSWPNYNSITGPLRFDVSIQLFSCRKLGSMPALSLPQECHRASLHVMTWRFHHRPGLHPTEVVIVKCQDPHFLSLISPAHFSMTIFPLSLPLNVHAPLLFIADIGSCILLTMAGLSVPSNYMFNFQSQHHHTSFMLQSSLTFLLLMEWYHGN